MNYKTPIGKIDIIAKDGNTLIFVEVKTRADNSSAIPTRQCTKERRKKLRNIVLILIYLKKLSNELPIRFNVLSILHREKGKREIEHFKDAIEI